MGESSNVIFFLTEGGISCEYNCASDADCIFASLIAHKIYSIIPLLLFKKYFAVFYIFQEGMWQSQSIFAFLFEGSHTQVSGFILLQTFGDGSAGQ